MQAGSCSVAEKLLRSRLRIRTGWNRFVLRHRGHCAWPWSYRFSERVAAKPTSTIRASLSLSLPLSFIDDRSSVHCYSESRMWASLLYFVWRYAPCNRITRQPCNGNYSDAWNHLSSIFRFIRSFCSIVGELASKNVYRLKQLSNKLGLRSRSIWDWNSNYVQTSCSILLMELILEQVRLVGGSLLKFHWKDESVFVVQFTKQLTWE